MITQLGYNKQDQWRKFRRWQDAKDAEKIQTFDPGRNNRVLKKRDSRLTNEWNTGQLDMIIRNEDSCGDNSARLLDGGQHSQ